MLLKILTGPYSWSSYHAAAWYYRGTVKEELNRDKEAAFDFREALRLNPSVKKDVEKKMFEIENAA